MSSSPLPLPGAQPGEVRLYDGLFATTLNIALGVLSAGLLLLLALALHWRVRLVSVLPLFVLFTGLLDMVLDAAFIVVIPVTTPALLLTRDMAAAFFIASSLCNVLLLLHFFRTILRGSEKNAPFVRWLRKHNGTFASLLLLSLSGARMMTLIHSRLLELDRFTAPLTVRAIDRLETLGLITVLLEDVPQLVLTILVTHWTQTWDSIAMASIALNGLMVLLGVGCRVLTAAQLLDAERQASDVVPAEFHKTGDVFATGSAKKWRYFFGARAGDWGSGGTAGGGAGGSPSGSGSGSPRSRSGSASESGGGGGGGGGGTGAARSDATADAILAEYYSTHMGECETRSPALAAAKAATTAAVRSGQLAVAALGGAEKGDSAELAGQPVAWWEWWVWGGTARGAEASEAASSPGAGGASTQGLGGSARAAGVRAAGRAGGAAATSHPTLGLSVGELVGAVGAPASQMFAVYEDVRAGEAAASAAAAEAVARGGRSSDAVEPPAAEGSAARNLIRALQSSLSAGAGAAAGGEGRRADDAAGAGASSSAGGSSSPQLPPSSRRRPPLAPVDPLFDITREQRPPRSLLVGSSSSGISALPMAGPPQGAVPPLVLEPPEGGQEPPPLPPRRAHALAQVQAQAPMQEPEQAQVSEQPSEEPPQATSRAQAQAEDGAAPAPSARAARTAAMMMAGGARGVTASGTAAAAPPVPSAAIAAEGAVPAPSTAAVGLTATEWRPPVPTRPWSASVPSSPRRK